MPADNKELSEALDVLEDVIGQACYSPSEEELDSGALSSYASGMRFLATHGRFEITHEAGRRVIGHFKVSNEELVPDMNKTLEKVVDK